MKLCFDLFVKNNYLVLVLKYSQCIYLFVSEEEQNLKIIFYESKYYDSFGSIFPMEDICALIPEEEADVAILEEPEHLNWLRAPKPYKGDETSETANDNKNMDKSQTTSTPPYTEKEKAELGWKFKFKHVVGIVHTNYKAYSEEYGQAAKYITTPMLNALNSLVIRAYCHRVILLSETLPSLCSYKEVTRNVHGVRNEFFESPQSRSDNDDSDNIDTNAKGEKYAPVYFIGKTIWAKGFDKILELEKIYREKHGDYFTIDVYGMGGDEKAVQRAFFGRIPHIQRKEATQDDADSNTADVFKWNDSIRSHLSDTSKETPKEESNNDTEGAQQAATTSNDDGEQGKQKGSLLGFVGDMTQKIAPLSVLGDLSKQAFSTTKTATSSAATAVKNVADAGKHVAFAPGSPMRPNAKEENKMRMVFAPPRSADEFRRNPIPARFLGAKDHALIRDIPEHKIFLNCSITEVLCTTTAEALAMGKFVILPKHRK